jgi:outer membrane protein OmpA-like peptidoglycan-associated protein
VPRSPKACRSGSTCNAAAIHHGSQGFHDVFHVLCLRVQLLRRSRTLLGVGRATLSHLFHLRNRPADLVDAAALKQADLTKLSKQIDIMVTGEGLKIELIEDKGGTFFEKGSPKLSENGVALLNLLSAQLKVLPNRLLIEGHTDAQPYSSDTGYTNWELSSDRANSARRLLQQGGVGPNQISQVRGYADQLLRVQSNPLDPSNRRISLIVQWVESPPALRAANLPIAPSGEAMGNSKMAATGSTPLSSVPAARSPEPRSDASLRAPSSNLTEQRAPMKPIAAVPKSPWTAQIRSFVSSRK